MEHDVDLRHPLTEDIHSLDLVRRFTPASQNRDVKRVIHLKHFDSITVTKQKGEFSDEAEELLKKTQAELQALSNNRMPTEFGGVFGVLLLIFILPFSIIALHMLCNESECSFTKLPNMQKYKLLSTYFDAKSILGYIAYAVLLVLLSALPFGGRKVSDLPNKQEKFEYVMNGFLSLIVLLLIGTGLELKNVRIVDYIVEHTFHLLIASILLGIALSVFLYFRSFYVPVSALNPDVVGEHGIYAFFMGRELNPRISSVIDLKMSVFRNTTIGGILLDFAYFYHAFETSLSKTQNNGFDPKLLILQPTLLVYIVLHTLYFLDFLTFESFWVTTFEIQQEAFGYMLAIAYTTYPFCTVTIVKYITEHGVYLDVWKLVLTPLVFALGYILYRGSNNQKDAFRKNPYSPALSHLETIPTTQGKKLLVSGFWGIIRHPNYLGDILIHLSFVPFVVCALPVIYPYFIVLIIIHRTHRDNTRCKQKYGAAWDRYCNKVKYILLPKVY